MKRWQKLLIVLLVLALLSQIPFAYRRYRLGKLNAAIQQLNSQRNLTKPNLYFVEYKGVVHVHSSLGGHSNGTFEEIIAAAKSNRLDFVVMTEHMSNHYSTADLTLQGNYGGVLFVNGNEAVIPDAGRLLLIPGIKVFNPPVIKVDPGDHNDRSFNTPYTVYEDYRDQIPTLGRGKDGFTVVAYPEEFRGWETIFFDGIEVYNVYTNSRQINAPIMFFDALWCYRSYPDLLFANFYRRPDASLQRWDQFIANRGRRIVAFAGNDAHSNVGLSLVDGSGKTLAGLKLDPYERSFRLVRQHVLLPRGEELTREALLAALGAGHSFIAFDLFGDSSGFSFVAGNGSDYKIQGDEIQLGQGLTLSINIPIPSRIVLLRDGKAVLDETGVQTKDYQVKEKGCYRVEVYLPQLSKPIGDQPWIISNPIYVK